MQEQGPGAVVRWAWRTRLSSTQVAGVHWVQGVHSVQEQGAVTVVRWAWRTRLRNAQVAGGVLGARGAPLGTFPLGTNGVTNGRAVTCKYTRMGPKGWWEY